MTLESLAVAPRAPEPWPGLRPGSRSDAWLLSKRADLWIVSAGGASLLVAMGLVLHWHGDRELDAADLLLSELHLGATYHAIVRRRLWRRMPLDVLAVRGGGGSGFSQGGGARSGGGGARAGGGGRGGGGRRR